MAVVSDFQRRHEQGEFEVASHLAKMMLDRRDGKGKILRFQRESETWVDFEYREYDETLGCPPVKDRAKADADP
eukprot:6333327-Alexandrium_andersonii.AAC.1